MFFYKVLSYWWPIKALWKRGFMAFIRQRIRSKLIKRFALFVRKYVKI
jgi:hypothetical protein